MDILTAAKVFISIVDCGSLSKAAADLNMSTAMVSRHLTFFEEWLKVRLINRTTRNLSLTDAGEAAFISARELLDEAVELEAVTAEMNTIPRGHLRISCTHIFGERKLGPALADFNKYYPEIEINVISSDLPPKDLVSERIDVSIRRILTYDKKLESKSLASYPLVFCASPVYLQKRGIPYNFNDLYKHSFITHVLIDVAKIKFFVDDKPIDIPFHSSFEVNDAGLMVSAALGGMGMIVIPTYCAEPELLDGRLISVLPEIKSEMIDINMTYLSRSYQSRPIKILVEFLSNYFNNKGLWAGLHNNVPDLGEVIKTTSFLRK